MIKREIATLQHNGPADAFERLRLKSLLKAEEIIDLPTDLANLDGDLNLQHKRYVMQARMAESMIADAIKLDEAALKHQTRSEALDLIRERMDKVKLPQKP